MRRVKLAFLVAMFLFTTIVIGGGVSLSGCQNPQRLELDPNHYYNQDVLSDDEIRILQPPVDYEALERVVGDITDIEMLGFGVECESATCSRFGEIVMIFTRNGKTKVREVISCDVYPDKGSPFTLFSKYDDPDLNRPIQSITIEGS